LFPSAKNFVIDGPPEHIEKEYELRKSQLRAQGFNLIEDRKDKAIFGNDKSGFVSVEKDTCKMDGENVQCNETKLLGDPRQVSVSPFWRGIPENKTELDAIELPR
jgi:hypothetical protein